MAKSSFRRKWFYLAAVAVIVALDLWSKSAAFALVAEKGVPHEITGGERAIEVIPGFFYLTRVYNPGGIWGIAQEGILSKALVALRIVAIPAIIYFMSRVDVRERRMLIALTLFCAGASGNLYDNLFLENHCVRDFLDVYIIGASGYHWPTFNIADSGITCGIGLLVVDALVPRREAALAS
jgi:signal peptidase II